MTAENSRDREQEALQRNRELESAERAISNMLTGRGAPEFPGSVPENEDLLPFHRWSPSDLRIKDAITEDLIVSHDPEVSQTPEPALDPPRSAAIEDDSGDDTQVPQSEFVEPELSQEPAPDQEPPQAPETPPESVPEIDAPEVTIADEGPEPASESPQIQEGPNVHDLLRDLPPSPPGRVMPGLGREGTPRERAKVAQIKEQILKDPSILKEKSRRGQQARLYQARQDRLRHRAGQETSEPPVSQERSVGESAFGDLLGDAGDMGTTFSFDQNQQSGRELATAANAAADAISITAEAQIVVFQKIVAALNTHLEQLNALKDKIDVDEDEDDF